MITVSLAVGVSSYFSTLWKNKQTTVGKNFWNAGNCITSGIITTVHTKGYKQEKKQSWIGDCFTRTMLHFVVVGQTPPRRHPVPARLLQRFCLRPLVKFNFFRFPLPPRKQILFLLFADR